MSDERRSVPPWLSPTRIIAAILLVTIAVQYLAYPAMRAGLPLIAILFVAFVVLTELGLPRLGLRPPDGTGEPSAGSQLLSFLAAIVLILGVCLVGLFLWLTGPFL